MPFQNDMNGISGCDQITINKGKAVFILIFEERNSHFFPEEAAEVSCLETGDFCNLIQGNGFSVMFGNIVQYRFQTIHILFFLTGVILEDLDGKIVIQLEQKFKDQAVEAEQISIRADIINDLKLFQNGLKHSLFGL